MRPTQSTLRGWKEADLCIRERLPSSQGDRPASACSPLLTQALMKLRGAQLSTTNWAVPLPPLIPTNLEKVAGETIREEKSFFFRVLLPLVKNQGFVASVVIVVFFFLPQHRNKGSKASKTLTSNVCFQIARGGNKVSMKEPLHTAKIHVSN